MTTEFRFSQSELKEFAILAERDGSDEVPLASVWNQLKTGQIRAVGSFFTEERCYAVFAKPSAPEGQRALPARQRTVLEALLRGQYPKSLAAELNLSLSTISMDAKLGLHQLGFECTLARFPPLLALAARAEVDANAGARGRAATFQCWGQELRAISAARPDDGLAPLLPPAEYAVVRGLVEGKNYTEIARGRGTSIRTVANQMGAAFRRLGVSGRSHLIHRLTMQPAPV